LTPELEYGDCNFSLVTDSITIRAEDRRINLDRRQQRQSFEFRNHDELIAGDQRGCISGVDLLYSLCVLGNQFEDKYCAWQENGSPETKLHNLTRRFQVSGERKRDGPIGLADLDGARPKCLSLVETQFVIGTQAQASDINGSRGA
jgi:hypothetical protein